MESFDFGPDHPFRGDRFTLFMNKARKRGLFDTTLEIAQPDGPATDSDLRLAHSPKYLKKIKDFSAKSISISLDTPLSPEIESAMRLGVGSALTAISILMKKEEGGVICLGGGMHHAGRSFGGGFCAYNDVAVAALKLLQTGQAKKILIIDTDAHAGDGTMDIFYEDQRVLYFSIHQDPWTLFPGVGRADQVGSGDGRGFNVCVPMPPRSGDKEWLFSLEEILVPIAKEFKPDIIFRNGGSDPHWADELTQLGLTVNGLRNITQLVRSISDETSPRILDFIGSGYNLQILPDAWIAMILGLMKLDDVIEEPIVPPSWAINPPGIVTARVKDTINAVKRYHKEFWNCF